MYHILIVGMLAFFFIGFILNNDNAISSTEYRLKSNLVYINYNDLNDTDYVLTSKGKNVSDSYDGYALSGIHGKVFFKGLACPPTSYSNTPPCSGPFPNHDVIAYSEDNNHLISKTTTDDSGNYSMRLSPGDYVVFTGKRGLDTPAANYITVGKNQIVTLDFIIDTKIR